MAAWGADVHVVALAEGMEQLNEKKRDEMEGVARAFEEAGPLRTVQTMARAFGHFAGIASADRLIRNGLLRAVAQRRYVPLVPTISEGKASIDEREARATAPAQKKRREGRILQPVADAEPEPSVRVTRRRGNRRALRRALWNRLEPPLAKKRNRASRGRRLRLRRRRRRRRNPREVFIGTHADLRMPDGKVFDWDADAAAMFRDRLAGLRSDTEFTGADAAVFDEVGYLLDDYPDVVDRANDLSAELVPLPAPLLDPGRGILRAFLRDELRGVRGRREWAQKRQILDDGPAKIMRAFKKATSLDADWRSAAYEIAPDEVLRDMAKSTVLLRGAEDVRRAMFGPVWEAQKALLRRSKSVVIVQDMRRDDVGYLTEWGADRPTVRGVPEATATTPDVLVDLLLEDRENPDTFPGVFVFRHSAQEESYVFTVVVHGYFAKEAENEVAAPPEAVGLPMVQRDVIVRTAELISYGQSAIGADNLLAKALPRCSSKRQEFLLLSRVFSATCRRLRGLVHPTHDKGPWPRALAAVGVWHVIEHALLDFGDRGRLRQMLDAFRGLVGIGWREWLPADGSQPERQSAWHTFNAIWLLRKGPTALHESVGQLRRDLNVIYPLAALQDPYISGVFLASLTQQQSVAMVHDVAMYDRTEPPELEKQLLPEAIDAVNTPDLLSYAALWQTDEGRADDDDDGEERRATQNGAFFSGFVWDDPLDRDAGPRKDLREKILRRTFAPPRPNAPIMPKMLASIGGRVKVPAGGLTKRGKQMFAEANLRPDVVTDFVRQLWESQFRDEFKAEIRVNRDIATRVARKMQSKLGVSDPDRWHHASVTAYIVMLLWTWVPAQIPVPPLGPSPAMRPTVTTAFDVFGGSVPGAYDDDMDVDEEIEGEGEVVADPRPEGSDAFFRVYGSEDGVVSVLRLKDDPPLPQHPLLRVDVLSRDDQKVFEQIAGRGMRDMLDELLRDLRTRHPRDVNNIRALKRWVSKRVEEYEHRTGRDWDTAIGTIEIYLVTNAVYYVWRNVPLPGPGTPVTDPRQRVPEHNEFALLHHVLLRKSGRAMRRLMEALGLVLGGYERNFENLLVDSGIDQWVRDALVKENVYLLHDEVIRGAFGVLQAYRDDAQVVRYLELFLRLHYLPDIWPIIKLPTGSSFKQLPYVLARKFVEWSGF